MATTPDTVSNVGQFEVLLPVGGAAVTLPALGTSQTAVVRAALESAQAGQAEVMTAGQQVWITVQIQTHWTRQLLLENAAVSSRRRHDQKTCGEPDHNRSRATVNNTVCFLTK